MLFLLTIACIDLNPFVVEGTAKLPKCDDTPAADLDGRTFSDSGTVTITSEGCGAEVGAEIPACTLNWELSQDGTDVTIWVDDEYRIKGRFCGDTLHLQGGWWLAVLDEDDGYCTYEDDSAQEVGIDEPDSSLTWDGDAFTGTLSVSGTCSATYDITLTEGAF